MSQKPISPNTNCTTIQVNTERTSSEKAKRQTAKGSYNTKNVI